MRAARRRNAPTIYSYSYSHAKYFLIDGRAAAIMSMTGFGNHAKLLISDGVAFVGSENFSQTALTRNREVGALVFEPAAADRIRQQFEADWVAGN